MLQQAGPWKSASSSELPPLNIYSKIIQGTQAYSIKGKAQIPLPALPSLVPSPLPQQDLQLGLYLSRLKKNIFFMHKYILLELNTMIYLLVFSFNLNAVMLYMVFSFLFHSAPCC